MLERLEFFDRNRLQQIANMIFPAALESQVTAPEMVQHIIRVNARAPLGPLLVQLVDFVEQNTMDARSAAKYREGVGRDVDAIDMIFLDALPVLEKGRGPTPLTTAELKRLRVLLSALKNYDEIHYRATAGLLPANDHQPLRPMPA